MEHEYSVSVVIDTYNYARYIKQAIDSALAQTIDRNEFEVIVVDDGSTDDTSAIIASYGSKVAYLRKPNRGQASAFNMGVAAAQGKVICFLDADDYFYPTKLECVLAEFAKSPSIGVVYNRYDLVNERGEVVAGSMPKHVKGGDLGGRTLLGYVTGCPSSGISVLKSIASKVIVPEESFTISADYFYLNIFPLMARAGIVANSQHAYRIHHDNRYLTKSPADQLEIHSRQSSVIWKYASDSLNKEFFRAMYDLQWIGQAQSVTRQLKIFAVGISYLTKVHAPLRLRIWTLAKMCAQLAMPPQLYSRLRIVRDQRA
jgi:glycosyltransferase involved in cell wall biosynthesis